jgi:tRNA-binding protein
MTATWEEFERLELSVGRVVEVGELTGTRKAFRTLTIDFGNRGLRTSAAQIPHYRPEDLVGRQVVAVLGFEPRRVAGFESEVLVLGAMSDEKGVVLLRPDDEVEDGTSVA